jgi:hypothetical protein
MMRGAMPTIGYAHSSSARHNSRWRARCLDNAVPTLVSAVCEGHICPLGPREGQKPTNAPVKGCLDADCGLYLTLNSRKHGHCGRTNLNYTGSSTRVHS